MGRVTHGNVYRPRGYRVFTYGRYAYGAYALKENHMNVDGTVIVGLIIMFIEIFWFLKR